MNLLISLVNNATLLISLAMLQSFVMMWVESGPRKRELYSGFLFGTAAILGMFMSVQVLPGIVFDGRSIVLSMAGLFGGPVVAAVTAMLAASYRFLLGGAGVGMGVAVIVMTSALGVAGYFLRKSGRLKLGWTSLYLFGVVVHLSVLASMLALPAAARGQVFGAIAAPMMLVFPVATVLFGLLLLLAEKSAQSARMLLAGHSRLVEAEANAHIGHWWLEAETLKAYWADEIYRILGAGPDLPAGLDTLRRFVHPDDWDDLHASLMRALDQGENHHRQYRILRSDGEVRWVDCRGKPVRNEKGKILRVIGTFQDVTERVQAEQAVLAAGQRLSKAQALGHVGNWEYDLASGNIWASDEAFRLYGMEPPPTNELPIDKVESCIYERERVHQALVDLIESGKPYDLEFAIRPQGQTRDIIIASKAELIRDDAGRPVKVLGAIQDITQRKAQEERIELQRRFLKAVLESASDAIVACDKEGRLTLFNRAAKALRHIDDSQLGTTSWPETFELYEADGATRIPPDRLPLVQALNGQTMHAREMVILQAGGEARTVLATGTPVIDTEGNTLGAVVSMHDITERKQAERALREAHANLERQVAERTAELAAANTHLQELDRLKSLFIASMSHELRTPLNSIIGFTGMMLQEIPGPINDKQLDYLTRVANSSQHLLALIGDVIDIAKVEAGKAQAYIEHFDLGEMVKEAAEQIRVQAEKKGLRLVVEAPAGVVIASDRRRLMQCLLNYLSNALKYTRQGSITIRLSESTQDAGELEIAVIDTGVGIDPADQERLFQQFSRIDSDITRRTSGTGLGLYLTRKLAAEVLGGRVSMDSKPGEGSTFRLHLPREVKP
jgi:PAS domain S-box-containing protein